MKNRETHPNKHIKILQQKLILILAPILFTLSPPTTSEPAAALHLEFHIGASSEKNSFIGGTILNKGIKGLSGGFITFSLFDDKCQFLESKSYSFYKIPNTHKHNFKIPIKGPLHRYQITELEAYDMTGRNLSFIDDNAATAEKLKTEAIDKCLNEQNSK